MNEAPIRILLVEDDPIDRMALLRFVEKEGLGYFIQAAASVVDAREKLAAEIFEIVLLDHKLCDGSGFELFEAVGPTPVIFITGSDSPETAVRAMKLGASDYLLKDLEGNYLRLLPVAVERALKQRKAEQDRIELQAMLHQSQKTDALGTLAGGIAHEFNNLLAIMLSYVELSKLDLTESPEVMSNLDEALKAGQRAKEIIQKILTFSRSQTDEQNPIVFEPVVEEALQLLRSTLPTTVSISMEFASGSTVIRANRTQVQQAVVNVCNNAWQAMPNSAGLIRVTTSIVQSDPAVMNVHPKLHKGCHVRLSIADDGVGMESATLARVLDPFFTTKPPGQGTGLGMSVVHGIMNTHQGAVTIESKPRDGTTVHLYFPICDEQTSSGNETSHLFKPCGRGQRILLVDDEPALLSVGAKLLERIGYQVFTCRCAEEAMSSFRQKWENFDLVITDFDMPRLNGISMAEALKKIRPNLPVIITTGFSDGDLVERAHQSGVATVLLKPVSPFQLAEAASRALLEPVRTT